MNRGSYAYKKAKAEFLAQHEEHGGWYKCFNCGLMTQYPELDHIDRTGMGGSPRLLMDRNNWQLLCGSNDNNCHGKKDSGFR